MTDKPSFEERVTAGEGAVSIINQPIDYSVDFAVEGETATESVARKQNSANLKPCSSEGFASSAQRPRKNARCGGSSIRPD